MILLISAFSAARITSVWPLFFFLKGVRNMGLEILLQEQKSENPMPNAAYHTAYKIRTVWCCFTF
jgi:hypothetical protein